MKLRCPLLFAGVGGRSRVCAARAQIRVLLVALVVLAGSGATGSDATDSGGPPDWSLRAVDGATISMHEQLAKGPVLVSFWALWCAPCLEELPHLDKLAKDTAGRLTVLAVNADSPQGVARVRPYVHSKQLRLIVPLDTAGDVQRLMQVGGTLPFLVLYDAQGNEVYRHIGYREGDEVALREKVDTLLGKPAEAKSP